MNSYVIENLIASIAVVSFVNPIVPVQVAKINSVTVSLGRLLPVFTHPQLVWIE